MELFLIRFFLADHACKLILMGNGMAWVDKA